MNSTTLNKINVLCECAVCGSFRIIKFGCTKDGYLFELTTTRCKNCGSIEWLI